jgi:hypothetical protein
MVARVERWGASGFRWVRGALTAFGALALAACTWATPLGGFSEGEPDGGASSGAPDEVVDAPPDASPGPDARAGIRWRDTKTVPVLANGPATFRSDAPRGVVAGDVLIGVLALGSTENTALPTFSRPAGWSLVRRMDVETVSSLAIYVHVATDTEPTTYSWTSTPPAYGAVWVSSYAGVDPASPIEVDDGLAIATAGLEYATPDLATRTPGALLVASFTTKAWSTTTLLNPPEGTATRATLNNGANRAMLAVEAEKALPGPTGRFVARAVAEQAYGLTHLLALRPMQP